MKNNLVMALTLDMVSEIADGKPLDEIASLDLSNRGLVELCDLSPLKNLKNLICANNQLKSLKGVEGCTTLTMLDACGNELESIDEICESLTNLRVLKLSKNHLSSLPNVKKLGALCALIISENEFTEIPDLSGLKSLNTLSMGNNKLREIHIEFASEELRKLTLSHNEIVSVPDLSRFPGLVELRLNSNLIEDIGEEIRSLEKLELLDIGNNKIASMDAIAPVFEMEHLQNLSLMKNQIEDQSKTIASLERRIDALKTIIAEICERHEIPLPDLRFSHYVPRSVSTTHEKGCSVVEESEKPESELMGKLIGEMIVNMGKKRRRYLEETKSFYATIFLRSPSAYRALSTVLPIPEAQTLTRLSNAERDDMYNVLRTTCESYQCVYDSTSRCSRIFQ